ncbi:hypothetical protein D047_4702A, partial [Vibrio parahaemolyticus VPTS-2010_2]
MRPFKSE